MHYAINEATTMTSSFEDDVVAYSRAGWMAVELWLAKVETYLRSHSLHEARTLLDDHGIVAAGACAHFIEVDDEESQSKRDRLSRIVELCEALGAETLTAVVRTPEPVTGETYRRALEEIARTCEMLPDNIRLGLEFLANHKLLGSLSSAVFAVKQLGTPKLGITLDLFHLYAGVSKTEDIDLIPPGKLFLVHVDDVRDLPRELWTDADRVLPGQGILPLARLHQTIRAQGYAGFYSLELFNRELWSQDPTEVAAAAFSAIEEHFPG